MVRVGGWQLGCITVSGLQAGKQALPKGVRVGLVVAAFPVLCHLLSVALPIPWHALVACRADAAEMYFTSLTMVLAPVGLTFFIPVLNYCSHVALAVG